jgi:ATP-dependent RNA helicase DDX3X
MSFDTGNMAQAMSDIANGASSSDVPGRDMEAFKKARQHGWIAPTPFSYASASDNVADQSPTDKGNNHAYVEPQWAHEAAKYEWKEEYGDVGPKVPELEDQLFRNEQINRRGDMFKEYVMHQ